MMPTQELPSGQLTVLQLLLEFPWAIQVKLYTNNVQTSAPLEVSSFTEPTYAGYQSWSSGEWQTLFVRHAPDQCAIEARARFEVSANGAPAIIRGWWALVAFEDAPPRVLATEPLPQPVTIGTKGDVLLVPLTLACERIEGPEPGEALFASSSPIMATKGGTKVKFRGNDRKILRAIQKAIKAAVARDIRWATRTDNSSMADLKILDTTGEDSIQEKAVAVLGSIEGLLDL